MKTYPLAIDGMTEFESGTGAYDWFYSKGHHDPALFAQELIDNWGVEPGQGGWSNVRQMWWRCVPVGARGEGVVVVPAQPGSRGAFPVTFIEK